MALILQVLFWILMLFLGLLVLLFLLSLFPAKVFVSYRENKWDIRLKYLWLRFDITGKQKPKQQTKAEPPDEAEKQEETEQDKTPSIFKDFGTVKELIGKASDSILKVLRNVKIRNVALEMSVGAGTPVATGILFGQLSGIIYNFFGFLNAMVDIQYDRVVTQPDFLNDKIVVNFGCNIALRPIILIVIGAQVGWMLLKKWFQNRRKNRKVAKRN